MDFNQFDTRTAADKGVRVHLRNPMTGDLLYDDNDEEKPCIVIVRGAESREGQKAIRKVLEATKDDTTISAQDQLVRLAAPLIIGFENVMRGDRPATAEDAQWFLDLNFPLGSDDKLAFSAQVTEHAMKRVQELGNGPKV